MRRSPRPTTCSHKQLRAERAHAENVRDGVGVPALGEHRHGDDAADVLAELAGLADGVQHFAHQVFVGQVLGVAAGKALAVLGLEFLDLRRGQLLEVRTHALAGFELLGCRPGCVFGPVQPALVVARC